MMKGKRHKSEKPGTRRPKGRQKPFDDGMQHFLISVPKQSEPVIDQAVREQVAATIEAAVSRTATQTIEQPLPKTFSPDDIEAALRRQPAFEEIPDYSAWFQPESVNVDDQSMKLSVDPNPIEHRSPVEQDLEFKPGEAALADTRPPEPGVWEDLVNGTYEIAVTFLEAVIWGFGILTGLYIAWMIVPSIDHAVTEACRHMIEQYNGGM